MEDPRANDQPSPMGVANVLDASDSERFGFFQAAAEFVNSEVWAGLKQTRHRQFGVSLPRHSVKDCTRPCVCDTVELHGLKSAAGFLCVRMHVCMYLCVCVCVCMYVCVYVCMHAVLCTHFSVVIYKPSRIRFSLSLLHICMNAHVCLYIYICIYMYVYAYVCI
jgi:hypothetical protein